MDAALLAAAVAVDPISFVIGIILVIALPVGAGMAVGWLWGLLGRLRRRPTTLAPAPGPANPRPANPGRKPGGKK